MKKMYAVIAVVALICIVIVLFTLGKHSKTNTSITGVFKKSELFTERDLEQNVNTTNNKNYTVSDGENITISAEGVYTISGTAKNAVIYVETADSEKVQLVLDNLSITNDTMPCIYIKTADKVFITLSGSNSLKTTGTFTSDDSNNVNGVIFSKQDVTLNGTGLLTIDSSQNGITGKDDVKITGGSYSINANAVAIRANDSIRIADGNFTINAGTDGFHAENGSDDTMGYVYIGGGTIKINATDDCIHGTSVVQIDNGDFTLTGAEGIEGTYVQINGSSLKISATGDGINAGSKSKSYKVTIEITGGNINIVMADGDTDGIDSNGDIIVSGGTINVTGNSTFDYDGNATFNGGTIIINGFQVDSIPNPTIGGDNV